jgi:hypothetical protein
VRHEQRSRALAFINPTTPGKSAVIKQCRHRGGNAFRRRCGGERGGPIGIGFSEGKLGHGGGERADGVRGRSVGGRRGMAGR